MRIIPRRAEDRVDRLEKRVFGPTYRPGREVPPEAFDLLRGLATNTLLWIEKTKAPGSPWSGDMDRWPPGKYEAFVVTLAEVEEREQALIRERRAAGWPGW